MMIYKKLVLSVLSIFGLQVGADYSKIDSYLENLRHFSGAVLIIRNDEVLFKKAYGYANHEFKVPNMMDMKFPIASNTKSFTAVAIMKLQEMGLLNVQDTIATYISDFNCGDTIILHHLLTHTSGIQNYYKKWDDIYACGTIEEMVSKMKTWELECEPGSQYAYSNSGYLILAYIIEKISGMKYESFIQKYIFEPGEMCDSGSICSGQCVDNKASGYYVKDGQLYNASSISNPLTLAGNGDIYCSLDNMQRWVTALHAGNIISKNSLEMLFAHHVAMEGSVDRAHGYGWFIDKKCGRRIVEYSGALVGYLSKVLHFIDDNISLVILTNVENREQFSTICDELPKTICDNIEAHNSWHSRYPILSYDEYAHMKHESPYIFKLDNNGQICFYFGGNHSCNPHDQQYTKLEVLWNEFVKKTDGKNCVVLVEGSLRNLHESKIPAEAIRRGGGEGGLITFLAHEHNIPVICSEPDRDCLKNSLLEQFLSEEIDYRDFAHAVQQFNRYKINDQTHNFDVFYLQRYGSDEQLMRMKQVHEKLFELPFNPHDEDFFYHITNPIEDKTVINKICRQASIIRDQHIVDQINMLYKQRKNVFVVYGHTHAVMQEQAIKEIWQKRLI